jgi:hypothetical protein
MTTTEGGEMSSYPKCSACGRPLPIKPNPVLTAEPGRSLQFYVNVIIITLAIWVAAITVMVAWGCD